MVGIDTSTPTSWAAAGTRIDSQSGSIFVVDIPGENNALDPALVLHGFPTCSFDWRLVLDDLASGGRRVVLFDFIGFGLSAKPDRRYGIDLHAETVEVVAEALDLRRVSLVSHDMGDSVAGEVLARSLEGRSRLDVTRRVVSNGSIYLDLAHLTDGQQLLLSLDDARLPSELMAADGGAGFRRGLGLVFAPTTPASDEELHYQAELAQANDGLSLMPRLIRYLEDRRAHERRYTGALETHPAPLSIIWGAEDPVARVAMAHQLAARQPAAPVTILDGVGHYPMLEDPLRFGAALRAALTAS